MYLKNFSNRLKEYYPNSDIFLTEIDTSGNDVKTISVWNDRENDIERLDKEIVCREYRHMTYRGESQIEFPYNGKILTYVSDHTVFKNIPSTKGVIPTIIGWDFYDKDGNLVCELFVMPQKIVG